ncbi:hypothetical protein V8E51_014216 [Hyaloscypha variabilis]
MASAPDIITYVGVPLAVLGVAPIIYNTISTVATVMKVKRMLRRGRLAGITRGDVINHVIEVELPRYTIAPLHREDHYKEYWGLCDYPSKIPGGSWTIFNWKCHKVGLKTQRIDYTDQLRQPQAEIGFEELISFLLDLGAIPDATGFRMLRGSGLWVPIGTPLLLSPNGHEAVLTIAPLDDSDGNLSLAVKWSSSWGMRDQSSLPPYWVLIKGTIPPRPDINAEAGKNQRVPGARATTEKGEAQNSKPASLAEAGENPANTGETPVSKTAKYIPLIEEAPPAIRCQIGIKGLIAAIPDDFDPQLFDQLNIGHLEVDDMNANSTGIWFASAITAFGTSSQTILWNYKIPSEILAFAKKDSIPCGILVLLDVVEESATPEWATQYDDEAEAREAQMRKLQEQSRAMMKESQLPPDQKAAAFNERRLKAHDDWMESLKATRRRDAQRAETRMVEAIQSPKWDNKLVAQHNLAWLKKKDHVEESHDLKRVVEVLLWRMVNDPKLAADLATVLDSWKAFVDNGGIRRIDFQILKENQVAFANASLLVAIIEESVSAAHGSLAMDLQECIRVWKKVRLG